MVSDKSEHTKEHPMHNSVTVSINAAVIRGLKVITPGRQCREYECDIAKHWKPYQQNHLSVSSHPSYKNRIFLK